MRRLAWFAGPLALFFVIGVATVAGPVRAAGLVGRGLTVLCSAGAVFGIAYTLLAHGLIGRYFARRPAEPKSFPAVTVLKPLHGDEWNLLRNLSTFCEQDYPGHIQFVFGTRDPADPALKAIDELRRLHPEADIVVVADSRLHGNNLKISNLINMLPLARHDVLIFADSDIRVDSHYLRNLSGELQRPGIAAVTCLYRGVPAPGFWPLLSANATNGQFFPNAVTGLALGLAHPCFGQTIGMRRETLERIGGLSPFGQYLAEDHAIGAAVRRIGGGVSIPPFTVDHTCAETSFPRLLSHELRWSRTIRGVDPVGHLGSVVTHPFALALLAVIFSGSTRQSWIIAGIALAVRLALKRRTNQVLQLSDHDLWLVPLGDVIAFPVFIASLFSAEVSWRGARFKVDRTGHFSPLPAKKWIRPVISQRSARDGTIGQRENPQRIAFQNGSSPEIER